MAEDQDLAIDRVHGVERLLHDQTVLGTDGRAAGAGQLAEELRRQRGRRRVGHPAAMQRHLHCHVAHLGAQVSPVELGQLLPGQQPEPEEERQRARPVPDVVGKPRLDLDVRILEDVRRVDPADQAAVEPNWTMRRSRSRWRAKSSASACLVAVAGAAEKVVARLRIAWRFCPHDSLICADGFRPPKSSVFFPDRAIARRSPRAARLVAKKRSRTQPWRSFSSGACQ